MVNQIEIGVLLRIAKALEAIAGTLDDRRVPSCVHCLGTGVEPGPEAVAGSMLCAASGGKGR